MSGDLKNPSKSIPTGTLSGLLLTFFTYAAVIFSMAASITRQSFYNNVNVIQIVSIPVVYLGPWLKSPDKCIWDSRIARRICSFLLLIALRSHRLS